MNLLMKVLVCQLVLCVHYTVVFCQQPIQEFDYLRPRLTYIYDIKKYLNVPDIKFGLPRKLHPEFKMIPANNPTNVLSGLKSLPFQQSISSTSARDVMEKNNKQSDLDCSSMIKLDCKEHRKLIDEVFKDYPKISSNTNIATTDSGNDDAFKMEGTTETATIDYESTTFLDDELANRVSPELVASLLG